MSALASSAAKWSLAVTGVLLALIPLAHGATSSHDPVLLLLEVALPTALLGLVVFAGVWFARTEPPWFVATTTQWTLAGVGGMLVAVLWVLLLLQHRDVPLASTSELIFPAVAIGAVLGLALGTTTARDRQVGSQLDAERERLALLNDLLRHNVLNAMQVILGRAELLRERTDSDHAETILQWGNTVTRQVQELRLLLDADGDPEPTALAPVVREEVSKFRDRSDVDIAVDVPDARVVADDALGALVESLLVSARDRAEGPLGVRVTGEATSETVTLTVSDDGPPLSDAQREALDDPADETTPDVFGFGLYLVQVLAARYGGSVTAADGGVRVTLRRADSSAFGNP